MTWSTTALTGSFGFILQQNFPTPLKVLVRGQEYVCKAEMRWGGGGWKRKVVSGKTWDNVKRVNTNVSCDTSTVVAPVVSWLSWNCPSMQLGLAEFVRHASSFPSFWPKLFAGCIYLLRRAMAVVSREFGSGWEMAEQILWQSRRCSSGSSCGCPSSTIQSIPRDAGGVMRQGCIKKTSWYNLTAISVE